MANPLRGETSLQVGETIYTLALGINEIAELEVVTGAGIVEIAGWFGDPSKLRVNNMRAALWAALRRHHKGLSLEDAGNLIGEIGLAPIVDKLGEAVQASFPRSEPSGGNPQKRARAGTGKRS